VQFVIIFYIFLAVRVTAKNVYQFEQQETLRARVAQNVQLNWRNSWPSSLKLSKENSHEISGL
jgi:hypothetical protein